MDNTRAIPLEDLEELWRRRGVPLREKTLWRLLYETAARASEVLALNVEDIATADTTSPTPHHHPTANSDPYGSP